VRLHATVCTTFNADEQSQKPVTFTPAPHCS
jgi:hypothetical protein